MLNLNSPDDNSNRNSLQDPVPLNVGGEIYTTTLDTLTRCRDSMLGAMFTGQIPVLRDNRGNVFIDRDGKVFRYILNYLRSSSLDLPHGFSELELLRREADFFQIRPLLEEIRHYEASVPLSLRGGPLGAMIMVNVDSKVRVFKVRPMCRSESDTGLYKSCTDSLPVFLSILSNSNFLHRGKY
ncbi:BTB/POZ domain-containing protein KCTD21-like [Morone saxatilis]|uniref:BTB/POZ domain-containing protein KCTD21-like n=1 Tax=Morone saxatilis TaxID=34816 RepID=UPI0015E1F142|nr:BTB/POZ domain-containing protein KCTD21-like [Morone saxatilis]